MKVLLQRVSEARVLVSGEEVGAVHRGLLIFVCAVHADNEAVARKLAAKVAKLRIFADEAGKMNLSILDIEGSALVVSQFTLAADTKKGNRPSFINAAAPDLGEALYQSFADALKAEGLTVAQGRFGAEMEVHLVNDGPVTIWLEG